VATTSTSTALLAGWRVGIFVLLELCLKLINTSVPFGNLLAKSLILCMKSNDFPTEGWLAIGSDRRIY